MAKFKNLLVISTDFTKIPNKFFEIFSKDYNEMVLLLRLMNTMETFNSWDKLQEDKSFYLPISKILKMFSNNKSKPTILKLLKNLEEKNFIIKRKSNNPTQANFYTINCEMINKLCDTKTKQIFIEDEIQEQPEIPVDEKNSETESVGYNLNPAKEKQVSDKKKSTEKNTKKEESNALTIVETKVPIEDAVSYKQRIITAWNTIASRYETTPSIAIVTDARLKNFKNVLKLLGMNEYQFFNAINKALAESKFLRGIGKKWRADFDFFLNKNKILKVIEGAYRDNPNEIMEILQDPAMMSFKEAEDLREKIKIKELEEKYKQEEAEEQLALP